MTHRWSCALCGVIAVKGVIVSAPAEPSPPDKRWLELCPTSHCSQLNVSLKSGEIGIAGVLAFFLSVSHRSRFFSAVLAGNYWDLPCDRGRQCLFPRSQWSQGGCANDSANIRTLRRISASGRMVGYYPWFIPTYISSPPISPNYSLRHPSISVVVFLICFSIPRRVMFSLFIDTLFKVNLFLVSSWCSLFDENVTLEFKRGYRIWFFYRTQHNTLTIEPV